MSRKIIRIVSGKGFVFLDVPEVATQQEIEMYLISYLKVEFSPRFEIMKNSFVKEGLTLNDLRKHETEKVKNRRIEKERLAAEVIADKERLQKESEKTLNTDDSKKAIRACKTVEDLEKSGYADDKRRSVLEVYNQKLEMLKKDQ